MTSSCGGRVTLRRVERSRAYGLSVRLMTLGALSSALLLGGVSEVEARRTRASYEEEVSALQLTLERSPSDHKARLRLTRVLLTLKRYEAALTTIQPLTVLSEPPQELELQSLYYRGFIERQLKRYDQAEGSLQTVISKSSNVGLKCDALFGLAKSLELKGDPTGASETYKQFISLEKRPVKAKWVEAAKKSVTRLSAAVVPIERGGAELEGEDKVTEAEGAAARSTASASRGRAVVGDVPPTAPVAPSSAQSDAEPKTALKTASTPKPKATSLGAQRDAAAKPTVGPRARDASDQGAPTPKAPKTQGAAQRSGAEEVSISQADERFAKGDYRAAAELYRTLSQGNLPGGDVRANLLHRASVSAFLAGQYRDAQIDAEEALSAQPQGEPLKRTLKGLAVMSALKAPPLKAAHADVRLALREGRFEDALTLTRQLREMEGESPDLSRYEGKSLMGLGQYKAAMSALARAAKAGAHPHVSLELAMAAERAGDVPVATRAYRRVIQSLEPALRARSSVARQASEGLARLGVQE